MSTRSLLLCDLLLATFLPSFPFYFVYNMKFEYQLHVLSTGAEGTGPSLVLKADTKRALGGGTKPWRRYIFNAGEGFQRICKEQKFKLHHSGK